MKIEYATEADVQFISENDKHVSKQLIKNKLREKEIIVAKNPNDEIIGWLRYSYFWDQIPFMNMLYLVKSYRNQGIGKQLVQFWEIEMMHRGFDTVMTSTLSNESAQHFYRKLEYKDAGSLCFEEEAIEILFIKRFSK